MKFLKGIIKKMESVAVITEFNPFHNGHALLARQVKEAFPDHALIAIMSGSTVQRGELAVYDKYERAKTAVINGFDAVLELPFPFSCSAGEQFASAGVYIANAIGASVLAFGSECGDLDALSTCASELSEPEFVSALEAFCENNREMSVPEARAHVYLTMYGKELPIKSNDILGIEYLRAIFGKLYPITPYVIHRTENFTATDSRMALKNGDEKELERLIPKDAAYTEMNKGLRGISGLILGALRLGFGNDSGNGIVNAMRTCAERSAGFEGFVSMLPTKTYTMARLRREMIACLFSVTEADKNDIPAFTTLLAANKTGQRYLSSVKKTLRIPILTRYSDAKVLGERGKAQLERAVRADSVYCLAFDHPVTPVPFKTPYIEK